jgi:Fic family protein
MIFSPPNLTDQDQKVLELIRSQRDRLRIYTQNPKRWSGSLRRSTLARAIQGSNSIEGYHASMDEAIAAVENEPPIDERTETWLSIVGYRNALTYIMQASTDPYFEFSKQFLKSLQFMMIGHDMTKQPGQWRPGSVFVVNSTSGDVVYEAPSADRVNDLIQELVVNLSSPCPHGAMVGAAMAHLNLTMIHPFKDGNGRMARALQTFVLAREGILHPTFSSIEEWLGNNTPEYYAVLAQVGQGSWHPKNDALPWVRFCLKAHYQQAATLLRRNDEYGRIFEGIEAIIAKNKLPDRMAIPIFDAALGFRLSNGRYRADTEVSEFVASRERRAAGAHLFRGS